MAAVRRVVRTVPFINLLFQSSRCVGIRNLSVDVDDNVSGITGEQKQLRETVNNFCQKELAPYADQIDKENNFPQLRVLEEHDSFFVVQEAIRAHRNDGNS